MFGFLFRRKQSTDGGGRRNSNKGSDGVLTDESRERLISGSDDGKFEDAVTDIISLEKTHTPITGQQSPLLRKNYYEAAAKSDFEDLRSRTLPCDIGTQCDFSERNFEDQRQNEGTIFEKFKIKIMNKDSEINTLKSDLRNLTATHRKELEALTSKLQDSEATNKEISKSLLELKENVEVLTEENFNKTEALRKIQDELKELTRKLQESQSRNFYLESEVRKMKTENENLIAEHEAIEIEREEDMRALQNHVDAGNNERVKIKNFYEIELQTQRNSFCAQEQQLMDDFEWKLHQIESTCRTRLDDKDLQIKQAAEESRAEVERQFVSEREILMREKQSVENQMRQVSHYKSYEAELVQLRGLTHEQLRALRSSARQLENYKFNEKLLQEDLRAVRLLLEKEKDNVKSLQSTNQKRIHEDTLSSKLEKQKRDINSEWECRLQTECSKLRDHLEKVHTDDKELALESLKRYKDDEFGNFKKTMQTHELELTQNISDLKNNKIEVETKLKDKLLELAQVTALRGKEKLAQQKEIENLLIQQNIQIKSMQREHEADKETLCKSYEQKLAESYQKQKSIDSNVVTAFDWKAKMEEEKLQETSNSIELDESESESSEDEEPMEDSIITTSNPCQHENITCLNYVNPCSQSSLMIDENDVIVHNLRDEVASLQGSIKKLTSDLSHSVELDASDDDESSSS